MMKRDFTYINDIINGLRAAIEKNYSYEIFNLGNSRSENLMDMISLIEIALGANAKTKFMDIQPGDVKKTYADIERAKSKLGYNPVTTIEDGIPKFIKWYKRYNNLINL